MLFFFTDDVRRTQITDGAGLAKELFDLYPVGTTLIFDITHDHKVITISIWFDWANRTTINGVAEGPKALAIDINVITRKPFVFTTKLVQYVERTVIFTFGRSCRKFLYATVTWIIEAGGLDPDFWHSA